MSAFISDLVYFIGPADDIEDLWIKYKKAQQEAVQAAIENKENGEDFHPFIDEINENNTIYHGSIGVHCARFNVDNKSVITVHTLGDVYGNGFCSRDNPDHQECNPILVRLDPKLWDSGNIKRADKTTFHNVQSYFSDPHEICFKKCSFRHLFWSTNLQEINRDWPHLVLDDHGLDCLARGCNKCHLEPDEYEDFVSFVKTFPNRDQMKLANLEKFLNTDFYYEVIKQFRKENKIIDKIINARQEKTRSLDYYCASSFDCDDYNNECDAELDEMYNGPTNGQMIVSGDSKDLISFEKAVAGERGSWRLPFSLDSVIPIYRNKPDFVKYQKEHWGCKYDISYTYRKEIPNGLQYDFRLLFWDDDTFPKPFIEIISKKFPNLTFVLQATTESCHYEKNKGLIYEQILRKSYASNGNVSYEENSTFSDESIIDRPLNAYCESAVGDWIKDNNDDGIEYDEDDPPF